MTTQAVIHLSLISHTNIGKTSLARTLLGEDVGEVEDQTHTTLAATGYPLIDSPGAGRLLLWDTPGFGDSVRLLKRLRREGNPIGWFLSQVWDRLLDSPFWLTQQAVANVRDQADLVLYLVNAAEPPQDAGYLNPELDVLGWIGKPVIVLLNQSGAPRPAEATAAEVAQWRTHLANRDLVKAVLPLDAFTRCWVQEFTLLRSLGQALPEARQADFAAMASVWKQRRQAQFKQAMAALARPIAEAVRDHVPLPDSSLVERLGRWLGVAAAGDRKAMAAAIETLAQRLEQHLRASTEALIEIHQLKGKAAQELRADLSDAVARDLPVDAAATGVISAILSGAVGGLGADLMAGGLTFGGGMLAGAILGGLGATGIAKGVNLMRGAGAPQLRWDDHFLNGLVISGLVRYLSVAHAGRARGEWQPGQVPAFWLTAVSQVVSEHQGRLDALWKNREDVGGEGVQETELTRLLDVMARQLLGRLHPDHPVDWPNA